MGMGRVLKDSLLYNEGFAYLGDTKTITLPTLTRKLEETRGGGMNGPAKADMGMEAMSMGMTFAAPMLDIIRQWCTPTVDGVYLRAVCNYQADDSAALDTVQVIARGRWGELEFGDQETGEAGEFSATFEMVYYKLEWNGRVEVEIDFLNMIEIVDGVDLLAARRSALGRF